jgi:uncharacterized integral membrane protein (TIGR00697 family)
MKLKQEDKLYILLGLFVMAVIVANLMGAKITSIFGVSMSVAIFIFPLTFLITDIVEEVYGKEKTRMFVLTAFFALVLVLLFTAFFVWLPAAERFTFNEQYVTIFSLSLRMTIASIIAFLISQFHDIWAFNFWKQKTKGKHLWLRNNASTIVSQLLDTTIFMFLAFLYMTPKFTAGYVVALIIPYWLLKVFMALADTPFCYLGVWWLKGEKPEKAKK